MSAAEVKITAEPGSLTGRLLVAALEEQIAAEKERMRAERREERRVAAERHRQELGRFNVELLAELGLTGHPKAEVLLDMAWTYRGDEGYEQVRSFAKVLAELLS